MSIELLWMFLYMSFCARMQSYLLGIIGVSWHAHTIWIVQNNFPKLLCLFAYLPVACESFSCSTFLPTLDVVSKFLKNHSGYFFLSSNKFSCVIFIAIQFILFAYVLQISLLILWLVFSFCLYPWAFLLLARSLIF